MVTPFDVDLERFSGPAAAEQDGEVVVEQESFLEIQGITVPHEDMPAFYLASQSELHLGFLRDGRLRLREPINVAMTEEDGQIVAEAEELNEFGYGQNQTEAITDLQHTIAELYFTLEGDQDRLGIALKAVWETLQAKIEKR